ncbi:MAG: ATP synthase F1 subunit gamma [Armatimonadota bacterium]
MPSARDIRRRIRTVRNIEQITNAMKMVAAARLRKAQDRVQSARPYAAQMQSLMRRIAGAAGEVTHPLLAQRQGNRLAVVLFTSDRGLCGSYNVNLCRLATNMLAERHPNEVKLIVFGRKGRDYMRRRGWPAFASFSVPSEGSFADVRPVAGIVRSLFEQEEVDQVQLVFARFVSPMVQRPTALKLLPVEPPKSDDAQAEAPADYIFEPAPAELLGYVLPRYVDTQLYQALLESIASEHGARMTAMSNATNNASEMIERLTLDLNRARQAGITKELTEIVTSADALKG